MNNQGIACSISCGFSNTMPPIASIPPGRPAADPKRCSSAAWVWARHFYVKRPTAHRAQKGRPLRTLLVLDDNTGDFRVLHVHLPLWLGRAHDGVHCSGSGGATTTVHLHDTSSIDVLFALYEHRCVSSLVSVWRVGGECNLRDVLVKGYLEAVAPAAPPKANPTACCKHSMGLEVDLGLRSATRHGARELRCVLLGCNLLLSFQLAPAMRNVCSRRCAGDAFACM